MYKVYIEYKRIFNTFYYAIANEISVEKNTLKRLNKSYLKFTPIRSIITANIIEKYKVNLFMYSILCMIFVIVAPFYFLIKLFKNLELSMNDQNLKLMDNLILVANGRVDYLYNKLNKNEVATYININQTSKTNYISYKKFLKISDYFLAYIYSFISIFYSLYVLKNKTDILQTYVAYDWFLVYISLNKIEKNIKKAYFANHYDRWAVLFDNLFANKELVLLQHGVLHDELQLEYKLKNINTIYYYNENSKMLFKKIFELNNTNFEKLDIILKLSDVESNKKTILVIGQPQSIDKELEIVQKLKNKYEIYVKPHPLYSIKKYKRIKDVIIIEDRIFYPRVDLALCYESTLGLEYEASGVNVLWWKNLETNQVIDSIHNILNKN